MKKSVIFLMLLIFISAPYVFSQDDPEKTLHIKTVFDVTEEAKSIKGLVQNDVNQKIEMLGDIVITDEGNEFTVVVLIDRKRSETGMSSIVLSAKIKEPGEEGKVLYSTAKTTGAIFEIRKLCKEIVSDLNKGFLKGKYGKGEFTALHQLELERQYARAEPQERGASGLAAVPQGMPGGAPGKGIIDKLSRELLASGAIDKDLTPAEKNIVQRYPMHANRIGEITYYAKNEANRAHSMNSGVPEDAYRHVLWSYLLTREFGEGMAKEITDAHEEGMTGNTPAERSMDYSNNAVGRRYAAQGYTESSILNRVMRDPSVVRSPR